jgi:signal transduction histidine kinase
MSFAPQSWTRWLLYGLAAAIISSSLLYANYLARQLARKEQESVQLYADALAFLISGLGTESDDATKAAEAFFFITKVKEIVGAGNPQILLGEDNRIASHNLDLPEGLTEAQTQRILAQKLNEFRQEYPPIPVEFAADRFQTLIYGESMLLKQLRWFPAAQLAILFTFIGIVMITFYIAKRNEQNRVWVGLAKETAHQLGTPVSSLMAWIELLKLNLEDRPEDFELVEEMEHDVMRLENITERFSKIGSTPELIEVRLKDILDRSAEYLSKRMTRSGSIQVSVRNHIPLESTLRVNPQLFDWVIENLLKNALDAIQTKQGHITIEAGEKSGDYFIDVTDTGKGIPKANWNKVFQPGFTTKKRGWGLGLSLTRRIVEHYHRGKIFVKDSEVDQGTTFRVLLPKEDA